MSATIADILRGTGFVPVVPELSRHDRDKESEVASRVPVVPAVPVEKYRGAIATAKLRQGTKPEPIRARLVRLAKARDSDPALVDRIPVADLPEYAGMNDAQLLAVLSMLVDDADRRAGRVPQGDTAAILCRSCGPVWVHPAIAAVLPMVDGWPRALGCPWCFIRKAGLYVPRPPVTCGSCRHFQRDHLNPESGCGSCSIDAPRPQHPLTYPNTTRHCGSWRPRERTP